MPSLLPFTIPSNFAASSPGLRNPSSNFKAVDQSPESPPAPSYFSIGSPTVATVSYRCIMSDYSLGDASEKPYVTVLLSPAAADIADSHNETWKQLRDALAMPVTGSILREDGTSIRFYDMVLVSKLKAIGSNLFVHLEGKPGSVRN